MKARPTQPETLVGTAVVLLLAVIAAGILFQRSRPNPALSPIISGNVSEETTIAPGPGDPPNHLRMALIDGVIPLTPPELFSPDTLYEKINGKAELYLVSGFNMLWTQRFRILGDAEQWLEVFLYDMGNPENAYAVYSQQKRSEGQPSDVARFAYTTGNALYFVHGPVYGEMIYPSASPQAADIMAQMVRERVRTSPDAQHGKTTEIDLFPPEDLVPDSVTLISANAFGFEGLDRVYAARYKTGTGEVAAFISRRASAEEAKVLAEAYQDFLLAFGGQLLTIDIAIPDARVVEIMGTLEVIFTRGPFLAGLREAATGDEAELIGKQLLQSLSEVPHGPEN